MSETINTGELQNNSSSGGCVKALLWLILIMILLSCFCCAGFMCSGVYIGNALKKGFVDDPVVAQQKTEETFGELSLPDNVKPRAVLHIKLFGNDLGFVGIYSWNTADEAISAPQPEESEDATENPAPAAEEKSSDSSSTKNEMDEKGFVFFDSFPDIPKENEHDFFKVIAVIIESGSQEIPLTKYYSATPKRMETIPIKINGKTNDFTFTWSENKNKDVFLIVSGSFTSKTDAECNVHVFLPGDISKERVIKVLENIQK